MAKKTAPKSKKTVIKSTAASKEVSLLPLLLLLLAVSAILYMVIISQGYTGPIVPVLKNKPTLQMKKTVTPIPTMKKVVVTPKTIK